jgi:hypothetical protein
MPFAGVRDQRFYYEVGGEGDLVILLHGALANADLMEAPATGLASGFRALRFDRRGCGRTTPPTEGPRAAPPRRPTTSSGSSTGSPSRKPTSSRTTRGPRSPSSSPSGTPAAPVRSRSWRRRSRASRPLPRWRRPRRISGPRSGATSRRLSRRGSSPPPIFDAAREREGIFERITDIFRRFPQSPGRFERLPRAGAALAGRLGAVSARTFVLVGERDEEDRVRCARTIAAGIPGAELLVFPDTSRFLHVEESRAVMRKLTDFFLPEPEIEP